MENYLMINGKRIDLTEEQIKVLSEELKEEPRKVIHRVHRGDDYSCINSTFGLTVDEDEKQWKEMGDYGYFKNFI